MFKRFYQAFQEMNSRTRRRAVILAVLIVLLMGVSGVWAYYVRTRKPLPSVLPPAPVIAQTFKPHYLFSIYGVQKPYGVAVTPKGDRIYVTEGGGERLTKVFDRSGTFLFALEAPDSSPGDRVPVYVDVAPDGRVYVSDRRRHTVYIYSSDGTLEGSLNPPAGEDSWAPLGLSFTGGKLYITDVTQEHHRVLIYSSDGQFLEAFGTEGKERGQFWFPNAVQVDDAGRIYVSDSNNGRIQVFDEQKNPLYAIRGFNLPRGMAADDQERLFIVDTVGQRVRVYSLASQPIQLLYEFGDLGIGDGEFNYPNDIAADQTGRLYITDRENDRVQVWSY